MARKLVNIPLNRVEGDLEIRIAIEGKVVVDAWACGTLYRGFENLLVGRGAMDALVVTPRLCGICSTSHLLAAARTLDMASGATVPDNGNRLRDLGLMAEQVQSDVRQSLLMFMPDFAGAAHGKRRWHAEAVGRYAPLNGSAVVEAIKATRTIVEIVAVLGGQWPHSSWMVPGGVTFTPMPSDLLTCRIVLAEFRRWYEDRVLGCPLSRWSEIGSAADLDAWLAEDKTHRQGDVGRLLCYGRDVGLDRIGRAHDRYLSFGAPGSAVPAGFVDGGLVEPFDQALVTEDVSHAWYADDEGPRHPGDGVTRPARTDGGYSWAKAPRYRGLPAETGPLAEAVIAGIPLFRDLVSNGGASALTRQLARLTRPVVTLRLMEELFAQLTEVAQGSGYVVPPPIGDGTAYGLIQAPRGALGHWARFEGGQIASYQIVPPTAWHASPRDAAGVRGPWEQALIGVPVPDPADPVMVGHVVRSFDPCLVCTVHSVARGNSLAHVRLLV